MILPIAFNLLFLNDVMSTLSSLYHPLMRRANLNTKSCIADNKKSSTYTTKVLTVQFDSKCRRRKNIVLCGQKPPGKFSN